jgi:hypothetical protein
MMYRFGAGTTLIYLPNLSNRQSTGTTPTLIFLLNPNLKKLKKLIEYRPSPQKKTATSQRDMAV